MTKKLRHPKDRYAPKTENHQEYWDCLTDNLIKYLACTGPSGSAKSTLACKFAAQEMAAGKYETLYISTPIVELDNMTLGYLAGDLSEKMGPHLERITQHVQKFTSDQDEINIKPLPLSYIRGLTIEGSLVILDESQNCTLAELKAIFTRIGKGSKLLVLGDFDQNDMNFAGKTDLEKVCEAMVGHKAFDWIELTEGDIVRSKHLAEIIKRFDTIT